MKLSALAMCMLLPALQACSQQESSGSSQRFTATNGPLSASAGSGGNSIFAPDQTPWHATFGSFVLCSKRPGTHIVVRRVRVHTTVRPKATQVFVRSYDLRALADEPRQARKRYVPFINATGSPPTFQDADSAFRPKGSFRPLHGHVEVAMACRAVLRIEDQLGRGQVPAEALKELIFTMTVGKRGGQIKSANVDYTADGQPYTLPIDWEMTGCGTHLSAELCGKQ